MEIKTNIGAIGRRAVNIYRSDLANGHMLVGGISGFGKTYLLKNQITQVSQNQIVIIPDTSDSFCDLTLPDGIKVTVIDVYSDGLGIAPFLPIRFDETHEEKLVDVASRFASVLKNIYRLGDTQHSFLYRALKQAMQIDGNTNDKLRTAFNILDVQEEEGAKKLCAKLEYLMDQEIFTNRLDFPNEIFTGSGVVLIKLSRYAMPEKRLITEFLLWEIWKIFQEKLDNELQATIVLDECQTLNFSNTSPITEILTQGRKFGLNCWMATQFLRGNFNPSTINRLEQAAVRIYFKPTENDVNHIAGSMDGRNKKEWVAELRQMEVGQFVLVGAYRIDGMEKQTTPIILKSY